METEYYNFNGDICTGGAVYQKARAACNGASDYVNKIKALQVDGKAITLKRLGTIQRISYP